MLRLENVEDVLDLAILQEKAAQQFYGKLAGEAKDPEVRAFYRILVEEECSHETKLHWLKRSEYALREPDLEDLKSSGYLNAQPVPPETDLRGAMEFALMKERSARLVYSFLADRSEITEITDLFRTLAQQEEKHMQFFEKMLKSMAKEGKQHKQP